MSQGVGRWHAALIAKGLHRLRRASSIEPYGTCCALLIEAAPAGVLGRQFVMQPEFFFEIGVPSPPLQGSR